MVKITEKEKTGLVSSSFPLPLYIYMPVILRTKDGLGIVNHRAVSYSVSQSVSQSGWLDGWLVEVITELIHGLVDWLVAWLIGEGCMVLSKEVLTHRLDELWQLGPFRGFLHLSHRVGGISHAVVGTRQ